MAKAFASDFDGTLWFSGEQDHVRSCDLEAISRFRSEGNLFGVASGRSLRGITLEVGDLLDFDFYILATGALVLDGNKEPICKKCVHPELVQQIYDSYQPRAEIVIHGNDTVYSFGDPLPMQTHIDAIEEIGPDIYGLSMWVGNPENAIAVAEEINRDFGDSVSAYANRSNVDVAPAGCSKGRAVELLKQHFKTSCIAAIGDSFNDVPMLESADISFTFNRSPQDVRERAGNVVDTVADAISIVENLDQELFR
ncbi:MAG: HAD-IIB family hydrolase [Coriobacteriales bacterium]